MRAAIERLGRIAIEARIQKPEQGAKALLDAAVRCCRDQKNLAIGVAGEIAEQFVALMFDSGCRASRARRGVCASSTITRSGASARNRSRCGVDLTKSILATRFG